MRIRRRRLEQPSTDPLVEFHAADYLRHNQRRQEHLASLPLQIQGRTVLEVGAGIGDHTSFFLDRGCRVVSTDGRPANLAVLRSRFPEVDVVDLDLDAPEIREVQTAEVVYCYGTLYHLAAPEHALAFLADHCSQLLLLETCVSYGEGDDVNRVSEAPSDPSQAVSGIGCRPTRRWVLKRLQKLFPFVYLPRTQPWHREFPLDWTTLPPPPTPNARAVFIASKEALDHPMLVTELPMTQVRH